ncbi:MAG: hypothetical protein LUE31_12940 [Lachnospiraceae bacterium]|nr:hypothetical protein [Lachnospiraceae bacterium]
MNNNKNNGRMAICFGLASAWFGTHCGSGFATGAQAVSFWTSYGAYAIFLPIISVALMAGVAYIQWEFCRLNKTYDYRAYSNALFAPYDKVLGTIYEILFIAIMVMGVSAVFAGAGELISTSLGIPYVPSVILVIALVVLLNMFGSGVLLRAASVLSVILIAVILIVCVLGLVQQGGQLVSIVSNWETGGSLGGAILSGILYGSFQCIILGATTNLSQELETKSDSKISAVIGLLMNGVMMIVLTYMLLCYYPEVNSESLPVFAAISKLGIPFLQPAYSIMIFLAFMTTAITCIGAILKRLECFGEKQLPNITVRRAVYSLVIILVCFGIAQFGLLTIIKKGYSAVGYLGIPFVVIPTFVVGIRKISAAKKEQQ